MKTRSRILLNGVCLGIGLIIAVPAIAEEKLGNVVVTEDSIVLPGTELSKPDYQAMNKILKQYDKSLYVIKSYENGRLTKTRGKLTDVVTDKELASEMANNVKKKGFTYVAVQVAGGNAANPQQVSPSGSPVGGGGTNPQKAEARTGVEASASPTGGTTVNRQKAPSSSARDLMDQLKPILEKYRKK